MSICPSKTKMKCSDEDGKCRQPDYVYCGCPVVNQQATEWLRSQGYEYDGKKLRKI